MHGFTWVCAGARVCLCMCVCLWAPSSKSMHVLVCCKYVVLICSPCASICVHVYICVCVRSLQSDIVRVPLLACHHIPIAWLLLLSTD